ncbi:MAG: hypothetical protein NXI01_10005 [Gammaproteobacteria bacterium]|uniref:Uncharacterized protein n=1 Tax=Phaeodactylibacter xiamenensis TaxID=1524460 RepID=A0A098S130_9BACT|nr:hypothetical protein [Phaeodactylibacter xiamenensis]KGE84807.1 hypothetical protein IX84_31750 [Phaeodactylibacter xiamenensis]MCR9192965.1 hypothetical protein [Gammaproteobacteria bacterium]
MLTDGAGNKYVEFENIRFTIVKQNERDSSKDWPESDVLRIQAYRNSESKSLHRGAEIPIKSKEDLIKIVKSILEIYDEF